MVDEIVVLEETCSVEAVVDRPARWTFSMISLSVTDGR